MSIVACFANASNGDTINVLAGTATWTSRVTKPSTKGLIVKGAGIGQTIITDGVNAGETDMFNVGTSGTTFTDISGFTFNGNNHDAGKTEHCVVCINMSSDGLNQFRFHHNRIENIRRKGLKTHTNQHNASGLADHNTFHTNSTVAQTVQGRGAGAGQANGAHSHGQNFGTAQPVYYEDNTFTFGTDPGDGCFDNYGGQMYVMRFNTMVNCAFGTHGAETGYRGPNGMEFYHNTANRPAAGNARFWQHRGGTGFFFNNIYTGNYTTGITVQIYRLNSVDSAGGPWGDCFDDIHPWDGNGTPPGYPCLDQIGWYFDEVYNRTLTPFYMWDNTEDGTVVGIGVVSESDAYVDPNREYYLGSTAGGPLTGTTGVGVGPVGSRPATCTTGVGYWATDEPTGAADWNKLTPGADGQFYKCVSTNKWDLWYTPYEYPHPLQNFETGTPPTAPSNLVCTGGAQLVNCTWDDNSNDETGFVLERGLASNCSDCTGVATLGVNVESYPDTPLAHNTTYYYRIKAVNLGGSSSYSTIDSATTDPAPAIDDDTCSEEYEAGSDTIIDCIISIGITGGETVVVSVGWVGATTISGCTDTLGATYTALTTAAVNGTRKVQFWITRDLSGTDDALTVTCTFSGASTERGIGAQLLTGLGDNPQIDDQDDATGTGTSVTAGAVTATVDDTYMASVMSSASATGTPTATTCTIVHDAATGFGVAVETTTVAGDKTCTFTTGASAAWVAQTVVLKAASGGGIPDPQLEYFVDNSGSPACSDTAGQAGTEAAPFCTIVYSVANRLESGNVLSVKPGTYLGPFTLPTAKGGTAQAFTVIRCVTPGACFIVGSGINSGRIAIGTNNGNWSNSPANYVRFEGFDMSLMNNCLAVHGGHDVVIQNNVCHDVGQQGIYVRGNEAEGNSAYNVSILNNVIHDVGQNGQNGEGIYVGGGSTAALDNSNNVLISGNEIYNHTHEGIELKSGTHDNIIENNLIYNCADLGAGVGAGIETFRNDLVNQDYAGNANNTIRGNVIHTCYTGITMQAGGQVYNNVIYNTLGGRTAIRVTDAGVDGFTRYVYHNTITNSTSTAIVVASGTVDSQNNIGPTTAGNNLAYNAAYFQAPAAGNFQLILGSAPMDAGANLTATVPTDIVGTSRPVGSGSDIGAYEATVTPTVSNRPRRLRIR